MEGCLQNTATPCDRGALLCTEMNESNSKPETEKFALFSLTFDLYGRAAETVVFAPRQVDAAQTPLFRLCAHTNQT